ncbi:hypothetical protein IV203_036891 [Nitzschia inconspicua]|uniref:Uncharacterized protein n=1 Tax=Nitzschia inconspicua TaxID=303405 RepID=A0A9K3LG80_9STRA|nr:hypothetical protein IV203_036891 [Nitzschia inconspicua]
MSFQANNNRKKIVEAYQVNGVMQVSVKDLRKEFQRNDEKSKSAASRRASKKVANIAGYFGTLAGSDGKGTCFGGAKPTREALVKPVKPSNGSKIAQHGNLEKSIERISRCQPHVATTVEEEKIIPATDKLQRLTINSKDKNNVCEKTENKNETGDEKLCIYGDVKLRKVRRSEREPKRKTHGKWPPSPSSPVKRRCSLSEPDTSSTIEPRDDASYRSEWDRRQTCEFLSRSSSISTLSSSHVSFMATDKKKDEKKSPDETTVYQIPLRSLAYSGQRLATGTLKSEHEFNAETYAARKEAVDEIRIQVPHPPKETPVSCRTPTATDNELKELRSMGLAKKLANQNGSKPFCFPSKDTGGAQNNSSTKPPGPPTAQIPQSSEPIDFHEERLVVGEPSSLRCPTSHLVLRKTLEVGTSIVMNMSSVNDTAVTVQGIPGKACNKVSLETYNELEQVRKSLRSVHGNTDTIGRSQILHGSWNQVQRNNSSTPTQSENPIVEKSDPKIEKLEDIRLLVDARTLFDHIPSSNAVNGPSDYSNESPGADDEDTNEHKILFDKDHTECSRSFNKDGHWVTPFSPFNRSLQSNDPIDKLLPTSSMQSDYTTDTECGFEDVGQSENRYIQITLSSGGITEKFQPNIVVSPTADSMWDATNENLEGQNPDCGRYSWSHPQHFSPGSPTGSSPERYHDRPRNSRETFRGAKNFFFGGKKGNRKSSIF